MRFSAPRFVLPSPIPTPRALTSAFHPYFAISNIGRIELPDLAGKEYVDRLQSSGDASNKVQAGAQRFAGEVDRIFAHSEPVDIVDSGLGRNIRVAGIGTAHAVVWNPWNDKCRTMADLEAGDYQRFVCVEPGIVAPAHILVEPGSDFAAGMSIEVLSLPAV